MSASKVMRVLVTMQFGGPDSSPVPMGPAEAAGVLADSPYLLRSMRVFPRTGRPVDIDPDMVFGVGGLAGWLAWADDPQADDKVVLVTADHGVYESEAAAIRDVAVSVRAL